jgi:hypothetical protein
MTTTRKKPERKLTFNREVGALFLTVGKQEYGYWLDNLPCQQGDGVKAFRLTKFVATRKPGQPDAYDVRINSTAGAGECECIGHLRHGHSTICKHIASLLALAERKSL